MEAPNNGATIPTPPGWDTKATSFKLKHTGAHWCGGSGNQAQTLQEKVGVNEYQTKELMAGSTLWNRNWMESFPKAKSKLSLLLLWDSRLSLNPTQGEIQMNPNKFDFRFYSCRR
jgi:hypothetical protein